MRHDASGFYCLLRPCRANYGTNRTESGFTDEVLTPVLNMLGHRLKYQTSVFQLQILKISGGRVGCADQNKQSLAFFFCHIQERLDAVDSQVSVDGYAIAVKHGGRAFVDHLGFTDDRIGIRSCGGADIISLCEKAGNPDMVYEFSSTAKVTFPSSGMAFVTASPRDIAEIRAAFAVERVSPEKLSQLAHVRFLHDAEGVRAHMAKHARILRPRFELVQQKLEEGLGALGVATWTHPRGGYFVSFDGPEGSAKAIVALMSELGVTLTGAGATWPYGKDPLDTNIRIAPTFPSIEELGAALDVFVVAVKLVSARLARAKREAA